jgi:uncharacterized OB-fold protein
MSRPPALERSIASVDGRTALFASHCRGCGRVLFPVGSVCAQCGGADLDRQALSPTGSVFAWTAVHRAAPGWKVPYVVALVDFPEGPRIFAQVDAAPEAMRSGMPVRVAFGRPPAGQPDDAYCFTVEPS